MLNEVIDESARGELRRHFTDHVTGRGPIAAIRVGSQPYGILPTSSLARWQPLVRDRRLLAAAALPSIADPFEATLLAALRVFDQAWSGKLSSVAQLGDSGDPAAESAEGAGTAAGVRRVPPARGLQLRLSPEPGFLRLGRRQLQRHAQNVHRRPKRPRRLAAAGVSEQPD